MAPPTVLHPSTIGFYQWLIAIFILMIRFTLPKFHEICLFSSNFCVEISKLKQIIKTILFSEKNSTIVFPVPLEMVAIFMGAKEHEAWSIQKSKKLEPRSSIKRRKYLSNICWRRGCIKKGCHCLIHQHWIKYIMLCFIIPSQWRSKENIFIHKGDQSLCYF